jgi:hypothetical protein
MGDDLRGLPDVGDIGRPGGGRKVRRFPDESPRALNAALDTRLGIFGTMLPLPFRGVDTTDAIVAGP